jgi:hypothetical protein
LCLYLSHSLYVSLFLPLLLWIPSDCINN